jgi:hypothetical protein
LSYVQTKPSGGAESRLSRIARREHIITSLSMRSAVYFTLGGCRSPGQPPQSRGPASIAWGRWANDEKRINEIRDRALLVLPKALEVANLHEPRLASATLRYVEVATLQPDAMIEVVINIDNEADLKIRMNAERSGSCLPVFPGFIGSFRNIFDDRIDHALASVIERALNRPLALRQAWGGPT